MNARFSLSTVSRMRPVFLGELKPVQAFEGGLTARSEDLHRAMPRPVGGIGQVRSHELINGHAAVRYRFRELIDDGHRRGDERFVARAIENHSAAALAEKGQDDRHPITHVPLILRQGPFVDVHHRRVEGQDVLLGDRALAGRLAIGNDDLQKVGHIAAAHRQTREAHDKKRETERHEKGGRTGAARVGQSVGSSCWTFLILHKGSL